MALLHESSVLNIHSAAISLCVLFIYCPIVIALPIRVIRSKCGSLIAVFGDY
ncbi:MAG: hypothetical protein SWX82_12330 [Cyanobacteriota bacterium]|nr:hypothetical protein [Cyanobacteriota bacterium]